MIECVFTLDYEIYGNGTGSLRDLVLDPTRQLARLFQEQGVPFVVFPEAIEFARIEEAGSDPDSARVRAQLRDLRASGHEVALHLHPWWANARYEGGRWHLDWRDRNLCALGADRVEAIVSDAITYLRRALDDPGFTPLSFRSGLWVMQPSAEVTEVLAHHGIRLDSSLFKGGRVRDLGLDYRPALNNGSMWRFSSDVNAPDPEGALWEFPIHTELVPFWAMLGRKRLKLQSRVPGPNGAAPLTGGWRDFLRFRYPRKLDFCRMTFEEMRRTVEGALRTSGGPTTIVAIGHSKDLLDFDAVARFLDWLKQRGLPITTFSRLLSQGISS